MRLIDRIRQPVALEEQRQLVQIVETWRTGETTIPTDFKSFAALGFRDSPPVFSVIAARMSLFTEVKFAFEQADGTLGPGPAWLNNPRQLLAAMILDLDLAGNAFIYRDGNRWQRLRPDHVTVVDNGREVVGYVHHPNGFNSTPTNAFLPSEIVHWKFYPSPMSPFLGDTWLSAVAREVVIDRKMTTHKDKFFRNAATPNMVITAQGRLPSDTKNEIRQVLASRYEGVDNAYKTMLLDGGAEVQTVGMDFQAMDFSRLQDASETRIASAAGVPPVLVGFKDGLQAATYSNYLHAMRRFADATLRPLWGSATEALATVTPEANPQGSRGARRLRYDDRHVAALQNDAKDDAEIQKLQAETMGQLVRAGYDPDTIRDSVLAGNFEGLVHTGVLPTTLQTDDDDATEPDQIGPDANQVA